MDVESDSNTSKSSGGAVRNYNKSRSSTPTATTTTLSDAKSIALQGMERALKKMDEVDSYQVFGNFVAEELRKIKDPAMANKVQRKLTRVLMDCLDEVDSNTMNPPIVITAEQLSQLQQSGIVINSDQNLQQQ